MIAIKDMEMPNACLECDLCIDYGSYGMCKCNNFEVDTTKFSRHKDCPLVEIVTCKDCKHWKDSDGVFRRGIGAESKCPINTKEVFEGNFYCALGERRE